MAKRKIITTKCTSSNMKMVKISDKIYIEVSVDVSDEEAKANFLERLKENSYR